jgi:NitT/TauT family transport system substrate-binding protein
MKNLVLAAMVLAGASACTERRVPGPVESVTIAVATLPQFSLVFVAQERGYFTSEGLAVTLRPYSFGKLALEAVLADQADLATCAETPVVLAELKGQPLAVLTSMALSTSSNAVVALKAAGISGPGDLAGKRIGVTRGTSGDFFLDTFLLRYGVDRRGVTMVDLLPQEMAGALGRGDVDAVATWTPATTALRDRFGDKVSAFQIADFHAQTYVLVGRRGFDLQRAEAARRVLRALLRAEALFRDHPVEAGRSAATAPTDDAEGLKSSLRQFEFRVRLDHGLFVLMEEEARWAIRAGLVPNRPAPSFLLTIAPGPLLAVKPEAVGLIR